MRISITSSEGVPVEMLLQKYPFLKEYLYVGQLDPKYEALRHAHLELTLFLTLNQFCELQDKFDAFFNDYKYVDDEGHEDYDVSCDLIIMRSAVNDPEQLYCIYVDDVDLIRQ